MLSFPNGHLYDLNRLAYGLFMAVYYKHIFSLLADTFCYLMLRNIQNYLFLYIEYTI